MKINKILEWSGFALIVLGTLILISKSLIKNESFNFIFEQQELIYFLGMFLWALGYMMTQNEKKKKLEK